MESEKDQLARKISGTPEPTTEEQALRQARLSDAKEKFSYAANRLISKGMVNLHPAQEWHDRLHTEVKIVALSKLLQKKGLITEAEHDDAYIDEILVAAKAFMEAARGAIVTPPPGGLNGSGPANDH